LIGSFDLKEDFIQQLNNHCLLVWKVRRGSVVCLFKDSVTEGGSFDLGYDFDGKSLGFEVLAEMRETV
jgi:hypothetical protein